MEDQDCYDKVVQFCKDDPLKRFEDRKTLIGVLILLAALYTLIYGVLLPFFRWSEQLYWVQVTLTVIPTAVVAVLLFMVGKHILQKEQERKEAESEGEAEEVGTAEIVEEATLEEGNVEEIVEAVLEEEKETEETEKTEGNKETEETA